MTITMEPTMGIGMFMSDKVDIDIDPLGVQKY